MKILKKTSFKKWILLTGIILLVGFAGIQLIHPPIANPPVTGDIEAPVAVKDILKRACYDCHSNQTNLRWYDKVAPVYWQVAEHVKDGRKGLNFSDWNDLTPAEKKGKLWEIVNQVAAGAMPVKSYELVHPSAKISVNDLATLKNYVTGMVKDKPSDTAKINAADKAYQQWQKNKMIKSNLPKAANGISYMPDFKNWQTISSTERYDNGTMRVIFGNDVAIKAIKENHINPWPNGTTFAKAAWAQIEDNDGNVHTGQFVQVEFMIKDAEKYAATEGWGWARFKTPKLVPYGKTALFTNECTACHRPLKDNDFVFTLPVKN